MFKNLLFLSLLTVCSSLSAAQQKPTIEILPIGMDLETYREMHKAAVIKEAIDHSVKHAPEELQQHISQNPSLAHYTYWFTETAESRTDGYCVRIGKGQIYYLYTYKIDEYISKIIIDESTGGLCMYAEQKNRFTNNSSLFQESTSNPKKGVTLSNFSMMKKKNEEILLKEANAHSIINAPEDLKQYVQSNSALSDYAYWFLNKAECTANAYAVKMANGTEYYLFKYRVNKYLPKVSTEPSGKLNIVSENSNYFTNDADLFQKIQTLLNQEPSYSRSNIKDPLKEMQEQLAREAQDRQKRFKEIDERMAKFSGHSSSEKNILQSISSAPQELLEKMNLESKQEPSILDSKYWLKNDSKAGYAVYKYMIKNEEDTIYTNDFNLVKRKALEKKERNKALKYSEEPALYLAGYGFTFLSLGLLSNKASFKAGIEKYSILYATTSFWATLFLTSFYIDHLKYEQDFETLSEDQYLQLRRSNKQYVNDSVKVRFDNYGALKKVAVSLLAGATVFYYNYCKAQANV